MDILAAEQALVTQLKVTITTLNVEAYPDDPEKVEEILVRWVEL